jgi:hypothetical protein
MKTVVLVVVILVLLVIVVVAVLGVRRNRRRGLLRKRFGPEYDQAVRRGNDRRAVEQRLEALAQRRDSLSIRPVATQEHERFAQQWSDVQGRFVDDPGQAVADADGLVNTVLRSRGYPVETFDDRVALVATDHQDIVERYRDAHETYAEHLRGSDAGTEQLRQAFLHYRDVFEGLNQPLEGQQRGVDGPGAPPAAEAATPAAEHAEPAPAADPDGGAATAPEPGTAPPVSSVGREGPEGREGPDRAERVEPPESAAQRTENGVPAVRLDEASAAERRPG